MNSSEATSDPRLGYEFDGFLLDPLKRTLRRRDGSLVEITPRVFDALLFFVERPGQLLDRETLFQALWPGLVVEDNNLSQVLSALRRALGDDAQHSRVILTVPRRGLRFVSAVREAALPHDGAWETKPPSAGEPTVLAVPTGPVASRRRRGQSASIAVIVLVIAVTWVWLGSRPNQPAVPPVATLAVLPFKPLLPEHRDEILELGMADSLIVRVSAKPGLVVRSIGSVRSFVGAEQDPVAAARVLDVQWILDGTIQRWGDRVRVTARLLRAADGVASWSGSFDDKFEHVFDVQEQISQRVARLLIPQLPGGEPAAVSSSGTRDTDAYQLYLTARYHAQNIRPSGLSKSIELYRRAVERDPRFALAHAGLADSLRRMAVGADASPAEVMVPAKAAAQRALQIDVNSADGHAALGWIQWWYEWDWAGAEQSFRRAIRLNPNVAEAHLGLGHLLLSQLRSDEGLLEIQRARELDPMSRITNVLEASYLLGLGRRAEGLSRLDKALEIEPEFWPAYLMLANVHMTDGDAQKALDAVRRAEQLSEGSAQATARIGSLLAQSGRRDEAVAILQGLRARSRDRYVPPSLIAGVHCALGERSQTLDALEIAYAVRDIHMPFLKITPCLGSLRGEPRFDALLGRMKLPDKPAMTGKL